MLFPVEDVTQYWPPRLAIFPWPPRPGSWTWMRVPPTRLMSGSATPRPTTRSLIRSSALSITPLSVPLGACSKAERPPSRSRPRRGRVFVRKPATLAPTRRATTTRDAVSPRFLMPNVPSPIPALEESRSVDGELELAVQPLGSAPAHHHALQEDLEVLHDVADLGVDRKLQRYRSGSRVYPEKRLFGGVVDPVVDVEIDLRRLPDPASVHVRLVGKDHCCRDGTDRFSALLLVVAHRGHDQGQVPVMHPILEHVVDQERPDLGVVLPGHHVSHVVEIPGDRRQLGHPPLVPQPGHDVEGDTRCQIGVRVAWARWRAGWLTTARRPPRGPLRPGPRTRPRCRRACGPRRP